MYVRGSFTAGVITNPPSGNLVGFGSMINYDADNWILFDVTIMGKSVWPCILAQRVLADFKQVLNNRSSSRSTITKAT